MQIAFALGFQEVSCCIWRTVSAGSFPESWTGGVSLVPGGSRSWAWWRSSSGARAYSGPTRSSSVLDFCSKYTTFSHPEIWITGRNSFTVTRSRSHSNSVAPSATNAGFCGLGSSVTTSSGAAALGTQPAPAASARRMSWNGVALMMFASRMSMFASVAQRQAPQLRVGGDGPLGRADVALAPALPQRVAQPGAVRLRHRDVHRHLERRRD